MRRVSTTKTYVSFKGRLWRVPQAFRGERLAIRPSSRDGHYGVCVGSRQVATMDLIRSESVGDVSEQASAASPD